MDDSAKLKIEVSARLKQARKALGLTQDALCQRAGMKIPSLRDYELGKTIPGGEALSMLMRAGIAPAWLLTGTGEMFCKPAELLGAAIASAIRQSGLTIDEAVARLGIGIEPLLACMQGREIPDNALLARVSEVTGYPLDKLHAAREMGDAIGEISVLHARVASGLKDEAAKIGMTADEATLLARYGRADEKGKALLMKISAAVVDPAQIKDLETKPAPPPKINAEALGAMLQAAEIAHPTASPARKAALAAEFYALSVKQGIVSAEGIHPPNIDDAA